MVLGITMQRLTICCSGLVGGLSYRPIGAINLFKVLPHNGDPA